VGVIGLLDNGEVEYCLRDAENIIAKDKQIIIKSPLRWNTDNEEFGKVTWWKGPFIGKTGYVFMGADYEGEELSAYEIGKDGTYTIFRLPSRTKMEFFADFILTPSNNSAKTPTEIYTRDPDIAWIDSDIKGLKSKKFGGFQIKEWETRCLGWHKDNIFGVTDSLKVFVGSDKHPDKLQLLRPEITPKGGKFLNGNIAITQQNESKTLGQINIFKLDEMYPYLEGYNWYPTLFSHNLTPDLVSDTPAAKTPKNKVQDIEML
jgi:hypothetical protein